MKACSRPSAPRAATSAAGVSHASTVPACISEIRSQRIASFMKWVEMKIVTCFSPRQVDEQLPEFVASHRVDAGRRLVEDQHLRVVDDRHRQREPLADAQGSDSGGRRRALEPETPDQLVDPGRLDSRGRW